ncbi:histidine phosphatase family protein [Aquabacterium sp.]|uniref:histidine phosphatase family protein n=1 Tax=Aquabacterium sp. TaxID=1872578 RepID=UPI0019863CC7|nr:histidine phosphatase family protein [Aquabacterium sp.]MBC7701838.1 histidine phosphatase family protein [Aquabacterium sp.]
MSDHITRLLVIRHGETAWNLESRIQGHTDIPLNEHGRWQAERLALALSDEGLDAIYASDLQRARDTGQAVARATGLELQLDQGLRERNFGRLEGMTQNQVALQWPDEGRRWRERDPTYGPEAGETLQVFYQRCIDTAERLARSHPGQAVALVAHGGVLDCFYRAANHIPLQAPRTWTIGNVSINRLLYSPEGFSLLGWADTRHLDGEAGLDETSDGDAALSPDK